MSDKTLKTFTWTGTNKQGNPEKGEIKSTSSAMAKAMLRKKGIQPKRVKVKAKSISFGGGGKPVQPADVAVFARQLATMLKAGVPMIQSFDITQEGFEKESVKTLVGDIKNEVASGTGLSIALAKHPKAFDNLFCSLVATGETSGTLDTMLERIAEYKEKSEALKAKIKKALTYPAVVLIVAFIVSTILLVKVVPQFAATFESSGAELPMPTQIAMNLSDLAQAHWWKVFLGLGALTVFLKNLKQRSKAFQNWVDRMMLKLPIVGEILEEAIVARFCRTLSTTFGAGVPVVEALDSVANAAGNVVFENAINRVKDEVVGGRQLFESIKAAGIFPTRVSQMVAIGEESGTLDDMLDKVASYYEAEVDNKVDNLTTLIEPMIMGFLAIVVGGLMIAMYMPLFSLGDAF